MGCYGVPSVVTPNLDALAASGARFTRAFTVAPQCSPSRATLATGMYPHNNGVMGLAHPPFNWDLAPDVPHLAQLLAAVGYETHLFGHQHVTPHVERLGFHHLHGFDRILGCHETALGSNVVERLRGFARDTRSGAPLYIEVNLEEPHRPYDQGDAVPDWSRGVYVPGYLPQGTASREEMAALQGAIRQADEGVGGILSVLREVGLLDSMLILFVADHGIAMPRAKCTLYDPGIEIALLARWPGTTIAGMEISNMVSNIDVLPTLLDFLDLPLPSDVQGRSFLPLLHGESTNARDAVFAEKTYHSYYDPMRAVRTDGFKYIRNFEATFAVEVPADVQTGAVFRTYVQLYTGATHSPTELYNLNIDPLEQHNLSGDAGYSEVELQLDKQLWEWMVSTADPLASGPVPSPTQQAARRARNR